MMQHKHKDEVLYNIHHFSVNTQTREVFLHAPIDDVTTDCQIDFRCATVFVKNIRYLSSLNNNPITIHMNTIGGCWFDGMAIYDAIQQCGCITNVLIHGAAFSMGTIITQAATNRILTPNSSFLVHEGGDFMGGTYKEFQSYAEFSKKLREQMVNIFANRCGVGAYFQDRAIKEIKKYIASKLNTKSDWWLDANQTIEYGFADNILGDEKFPTINAILGV